MRWNRERRALLERLEQKLEKRLSGLSARVAASGERLEARQGGVQRLATTAAWVAGAVAVLATGLYAGQELRSRYKFKRRTPYDYYAHAGDPSDLEFGVGI